MAHDVIGVAYRQEFSVLDGDGTGPRVGFVDRMEAAVQEEQYFAGWLWY
jgi:hypothetical protein